MSRTKLFLNNFLVYGLGSVISKIIPIIMLPIVTSLMTDTQYMGINDMANLVVSFAGAIALMGMYDAMFRMFFENKDEEYKKKICSTTLFFVIVSSIIVCLIMNIFKDNILSMVINDTAYGFLFFIIIFNTFLSSIEKIVMAPTRMQNKKIIFLITNTITPILSYSISIPLLLKGDYIYALPLAALTSTLIMTCIFYIINRKWFNFRLIRFKYIKVLIKLGAPLMPTFLMYWLCASLDRLMIKSMIGLGALGIYSVSSKIAHISQLIYTAFAQGWQYFAFSTMEDKDQKELISKISEYLLILSIISTVVITLFSKSIFNILAKGNYNEGYVILSYLFLSPLLLMVFQTMGSQFIIIKKTYPVPLLLIVAVIANAICNYLLIPALGIEGAAIATVIGYLVAFLLCYLICIKKDLLIKNNRMMKSVIILISYYFIWRIVGINSLLISYVLSLTVLSIYFVLYKEEIKFIKKKIIFLAKNTIKSKHKVNQA